MSTSFQVGMQSDCAKSEGDGAEGADTSSGTDGAFVDLWETGKTFSTEQGDYSDIKYKP